MSTEPTPARNLSVSQTYRLREETTSPWPDAPNLHAPCSEPEKRSASPKCEPRDGWGSPAKHYGRGSRATRFRTGALSPRSSSFTRLLIARNFSRCGSGPPRPVRKRTARRRHEHQASAGVPPGEEAAAPPRLQLRPRPGAGGGEVAKGPGGVVVAVVFLALWVAALGAFGGWVMERLRGRL